MPEALTSDLTIMVDGTELAPAVRMLLVLAHVEDNRALPDAFELRFRDPDRIALSRGRLTIGAAIRLGVRTGAESATTWLHDGEITAIEVEVDARGSWTIVRGYDKTHRLQRGRSVAAFRKMKLGEIVKKVAGGVGVPVGTVDATPVLEEAIQANVSNWDFLTGLAGDLGMQLSVTSGKVNVRRPAAATAGTPVRLALGESLLRFRAAVTASDQVRDVKVRTWDPKTKKVLVGTSAANTAAGVQIGTTPGRVVGSFSPGTLTVTDAPQAGSQAFVDALAQSLAGQVAETFAEVEAVVRGDALLQSGAVVELVGLADPFDGKYVITSARHIFDGEEGYQTWLTVSGRQDRTLLGLVGGGGAGRGTVSGLVPAVVTDTKDPDKLGRVKVRLPWLDDSLQTDWARTLQLGGAKGGGLVLPEVDDEVLVGFEQGHLERPFVLGGLYNGVDKPVAGSVDAVDASSGGITCRSMSSRTGHTVEILSSASKGDGVRIAADNGKFEICLDKKNNKITVKSSGTVEITSDGDLKLTSKGNASIEATGNVTFKAQGNLTAQAAAKAEVKAANVDVKADASLALSGQGQAELKSTGQTSVSGTTTQVKGTATTIVSGGLVKIN